MILNCVEANTIVFVQAGSAGFQSIVCDFLHLSEHFLYSERLGDLTLLNSLSPLFLTVGNERKYCDRDNPSLFNHVTGQATGRATAETEPILPNRRVQSIVLFRDIN